MFNQNLLARFGAVVRNTVALSVSALTAPLLALTAATGEALGALTLGVGSLVFRYGLGPPWGDAFHQTVSIAATGSDMHGEDRPEWAKVFLSVLKLAGAAMIAGFTAIFTNYLIRARLGGALEVRRVPDGGHVVVCGIGNIGYRVIEELTAIGERVVGIEKVNDNPFIATCRGKGVPAFVGDATVAEVLRQARADTAK